MGQAEARRPRRRLLRHGRHRPGIDRPCTRRSSRTRSACPSTGSPTTTRTPTRPPCAPGASPRAARSSAATPSASRPSRPASASSTSRRRSSRSHRATSRSSTARSSPRARRTGRSAIPDVAAAATWNYGELITGTGAALKPYADVNDDDGSVEIEPHSAISYAACVAEVEVDDETGEVDGRAVDPGLRRRPRDQPDARRGPDRRRRDDGARARPARGGVPVLPGDRAPRRRVRRLPRAGHSRTCPTSTT